MYTRTRQPGLLVSFAGGLAQCRINSKYLALQIKAVEEGLLPRVAQAAEPEAALCVNDNPTSFRVRAKREPGNLEIPGLVLRNHPGMTAIQTTRGEKTHMPTILGSGEHPLPRGWENWAKLPEGLEPQRWSPRSRSDSKDPHLRLQSRRPPDGRARPRRQFHHKLGRRAVPPRTMGYTIDADDNLYCTDDGDHTVRKCSVDGKVLLTIGIPKQSRHRS